MQGPIKGPASRAGARDAKRRAKVTALNGCNTNIGMKGRPLMFRTGPDHVLLLLLLFKFHVKLET